MDMVSIALLVCGLVLMTTSAHPGLWRRLRPKTRTGAGDARSAAAIASAQAAAASASAATAQNVNDLDLEVASLRASLGAALTRIGTLEARVASLTGLQQRR